MRISSGQAYINPKEARMRQSRTFDLMGEAAITDAAATIANCATCTDGNHALRSLRALVD